MLRWALLLVACNHQALPPGGGGDLAAPDLTLQCTAGTTTVSGSIPHGFFDGASAWVWWETAECQDRAHLMLRLDAQASREGSFLDVTFAVSPHLGQNGVTVSLGTDAAPGVATLTVAEPRTSTADIQLEGVLEVAENSFFLMGSFSARRCPTLDVYCV
jgi:hypothetical protein